MANEIWSQACIKLVPYYSGGLIKKFADLALQGSFGDCLDEAGKKLVKPYDITSPDKTIINLYLVDDAPFACGTPLTGHVILPTAGHGSEMLGKVLAHEIGHVLFNPLNVDDSPDPNHVMYHPEKHPGDPAGTRDGLFLSDCLGAHKRVAEDFASFGDIAVRHIWLIGDVAFRFPQSTSPDPVSCVMLPRLGNNLVVIEAMQQ